jgi:peptidoglycan/xylan/chitin deacetylase (PgdA/CDA1 family)
MAVRRFAAFGLSMMALSAPAFAEAPGCPKPDALGVSRTVEIDTTGGPGFGLQHYKAYDFLQPKEVVLTFDDGPQKFATEMVLAALAEQCTKATFFSIGKMALGYPEIIREVAKGGHTIGTHTWSHQSFPKLKTLDAWKDEMERGLSAVKRAVGGPVAPFFRYPTLRDSSESLEYLAGRNISMFSTDIDSFDFKLQRPEVLAKSMLDKLDKAGKGIMLMHDIHKNTAVALPIFLKGLKERGFKIVHLTAKSDVETLPEFDAAIEKDAKGLPQAGAERPTSSVVRTIEGEPTPEESATTSPPAAPAPNAAETPAPRSEAPAAPPAETAQPASPSPTGASPVANPVTTTTSSITPQQDGEPAPETGGAGKGLSERARDVWQLWFGK